MADEQTPPPAAPIPDCTDFLRRYQQFEERAAALHPGNKAALFAVLRNAGIALVTVRFDGAGDSGQIEEVTAFDANDVERALPDAAIDIQKIHFGQDEPVSLSATVSDAIEALSYSFLEATHAGWENNEGAYGEFTFKVAEGTVSLDHYERIETSEHFSHEF